jgi:putative tricarboxylic transport membrane protein
MFDVYLMVAFGLVGYAFKKLSYPLAPMVLALVLGDRAEENFRNAIKGSQGDMGVFFSNGLVGGLTTLSLVLLFWPLISAGWRVLRRGR